jgi:thioesterase domain-containing protein
MAKEYLDKILAVNPSGPFYLIGYSFGGLLAFGNGCPASEIRS